MAEDAVKKVKGFLSSPLAKFLIVIIVLGVIAYFAMLQYQKSIYNGSTKREVIAAVKRDRALSFIEYLRSGGNEVPLDVSDDIFKGIIYGYESTGNFVVREEDIARTLILRGIERHHLKDFSSSIGSGILLSSYLK